MFDPAENVFIVFGNVEAKVERLCNFFRVRMRYRIEPFPDGGEGYVIVLSARDSQNQPLNVPGLLKKISQRTSGVLY